MKAVAELMANDKKIDRSSYIYSPIFLFGDIVGYIYSAISEKRDRQYTVKEVIFVKSLADVASEAITKGKLFKADAEGDNRMTVENISQGGIMLNVKDPYLLKFLKENARLLLKIFIGKDEVRCIGVIVRTEKINDFISLGIKFTEISPKDERIIATFVESVFVGDIFP
jgi:hypothetical protein